MMSDTRRVRSGGRSPWGSVVAAALIVAAAVRALFAGRPSPPAATPDHPSDAEPHTSRSGVLATVDLAQQRHAVPAFAVGVLKKYSDDRTGRLAALIAYYGFFSVFPAMLAMVTILGFVLENDPSLRDSIAESALAQFPIIGDSIAESVSTPLAGNPVALTIGLVGALWAGMGMMQACQDAMNEVWSVERAEYPGFIPKRVRSLLMLVLIGVLLLTSTFAAQLVHLLGAGVVTGVLLLLASVLLNAAMFLVAYRVLTVADVSWRTLRPGALFAGAAYTALQYVGGLYVDHVLNGATQTYGTFAVVIGLLSWIYLLAQVMMVGAEINTVAARRLWPRSLFGPPATAGDRESHAAQATAQRMDEEMHVDVQFETAVPADGGKVPETTSS